MQMDSLLRSKFTGRIGCSYDGKTYVVPVSYAYDGEFIFGYTVEGLKTNILRANPVLCFQVDDISDLANWQSVVVQGIFEELTGEEKQNALQLLENRFMPVKTGEINLPKYGMDKPYARVKANAQFVTYKISILEKTGRFEKEE